MSTSPTAERIRELDWNEIAKSLDEVGYALTPPLLTAQECRELTGLFQQENLFRKTVNMQRVGFGAGLYKYFDRPLPGMVGALREHFYPPLASIANTWAERLRGEAGYPGELDSFLESCRTQGQVKPTPLLFRYEPGDHNALHQDLYGEVAFPFQAVVVLSPGDAYTGGELVFTSQRPRAQSLVEVVDPGQGRMLIFPNRYKPTFGKRSGRYHRRNIRHGVSRLHTGERYSLGIIFHDAK